MNEQEYLFTTSFKDLSECTEYYYNELGKLSQIPEISKKQRKNLLKWLVKSMNESIKLLILQQRQINDISRTIQNENYNTFKNNRKEQKPTLWTKFLQFLHIKPRVDVLPPPSEEKSPRDGVISSPAQKNICEENISEKNSKVSKNGKLAKNQSQAECCDNDTASRDDEPMTF